MRRLAVALCVGALAAGAGCGERPADAPAASEAEAGPSGAAGKPDASDDASAAPGRDVGSYLPGGDPAPAPRPGLVFDVEGMGPIRIELFPDKAPKSVASLVDLAAQGFYDGTTFHRVVPGFVVQGGDPNSKNRDPRDDGKGGPGYTLADEFSDVPHRRGIVSMANKGAPGSGGSQFFIVLADQPDLDGRYTVVGRVTEGMDVADRIAGVETDRYGRWGPPDRPRQNVVIRKATATPAR